MFSSRIVDQSNSCNIIRHSLADDLQNTSSRTSKLNDLLGMMSSSALGVWTPIFVDNDSLVETKMVSNHGFYRNSNPDLTSGRIGIENFYKFSPTFKSWTVSGAHQMSVDWILNKPDCYFYVCYGILGWYKKIDGNNSRMISKRAAPIDTFPNGSRLSVASSPNVIYIKISNELLYNINGSKILDGNGNWIFNNESTSLVDVGTLGNNPQFYLSDKFYEFNPDSPQSPSLKDVNGIAQGSNKIHLWIPDGDFFTYFNSDIEKTQCFNRNIGSSSYISAALYNRYANIYRILTLDEPRTLSEKNLKQSRAYKKLAHALSTSPFIDDFSIYSLDYIHIRQIIKRYINSNVSDISSDKNKLSETLVAISTILQNTIVNNSATGLTNRGLFLDTKSSFKDLNNNLVTNEDQLFKKLLSKYGAQLMVTGNATILPKSNILKYNADGIVVDQVLDTYVPKETSSTGGTSVFNKQHIRFGSLELRSNFSGISSNLNMIYNGDDSNIPLANLAKPRFDTGSVFNIRLTYKGKVSPQMRSNGELFRPDADYTTYIYESETINNIEVELSAVNIVPKIVSRGENGILNEYQFLESQLGLSWKQIAGPKGYFEKINGVAGVTNFVTFVAPSTGKFTLQCTCASPFGTFIKQKTFYIVDGRELKPDLAPGGFTIYVSNDKYNQYVSRIDETGVIEDSNGETFVTTEEIWETAPTTNSNASENSPTALNGNLAVSTCKINRIAINHLAGVVWPIKTNFFVREDVGALGRTRQQSINELSGVAYKFKYNTLANASTQTSTTQPTLALTFEAGNTIIKIHSIYLGKIRSARPGCSQCLSFYEPILRSSKSTRFTNIDSSPGSPSDAQNINRLYRSNKNPSSFGFVKYTWNQILSQHEGTEIIDFPYPIISTKYAPEIKSYGGYSSSFINRLGVNIPNHSKPVSSVSDTGIIAGASPILPIVTGYKLDYSHPNQSSLLKMCYQKALPVSGSPISFTKGVFHPNSGWIPYSGSSYSPIKNTSSVLKFNPGARDTFVFKGPGISSIKNTSINIANNTINPQTFTSSIALSIAEGVQWNPPCGCENVDANALFATNQLHKEYADIDSNISSHGYRCLGGGIPKAPEPTVLTNLATQNDEFILEEDSQSNTITYSFAVTGPATLPGQTTDSLGRTRIRDPRINGFGIKDIEVKLNFLNHVNTKNMVVWLDAELSGSEQDTRFGEGARRANRAPIRANQEFLDQSFHPELMGGTWTRNTGLIGSQIQNSTISDYLSQLTMMNSSKRNKPLRLYLLNQETVQNNQYNFSVKFSDNASKYNSPYDTNILMSPTGTGTVDIMRNNNISFLKDSYTTAERSIWQDVINTKGEAQPTVAATGYSDRECCIYSSIIKHNKLNITNNTFSKLTASSLFQSASPATGPCPEGAPKQKAGDFGGVTKFTLNIMILDETDEMYSQDSLNYQYKPGLDEANNQILSSDIVNSLCNWELILHVGSAPKEEPYMAPNLGSYGNANPLSLINYDGNTKYPGYSFIANLSGYQHLLPIVNYNAPLSCIADSSSCQIYNQDPSEDQSLFRFPDFPSYAILQILVGIALTAVAGGGGAVGLLAGMSANLFNPGFNTLFNYLREIGFVEQLQEVGRQIYMPNYNRYPFGSSEKILLNFKTNNSLWYTAEASIFKYHNTPILKPTKYKFLKLKRGRSSISSFKFNIVGDYIDLIDSTLIRDISTTSQNFETLGDSTEFPAILENNIINIGDILNISFTDDPDSEAAGLYVCKPPNILLKINNTNYSELVHATSLLKHNSFLCGGVSFFQNTFERDKTIIFGNRVPYDIFRVGDTVDCYDSSEANSLSPSSLSTPTIVKKALVLKNNRYLSVFTLSSPVPSGDCISPIENDHIFAVFDNKTSVEDKIKKQYNLWSLDQNKTNINKNIPELTFSAHSVGSYGNASPFVAKNMLSENLNTSKLKSLHEILNNRLTDKVKYNKITIYNSGDTPISGINYSSCYGFCYSDKDLQSPIFNSKDNAYYITPEYSRPDGDSTDLFDKLKHEILLSSSVDNEFSYRYAFVRGIPQLNSATCPASGSLAIENDFIEHIPIKQISGSDLTILTNRLRTIEDTNYTAVDQYIGDPENTSNVINSDNLPSIIKHYNTLTKEDPADCFRPNTTNRSLCYKQRTEQTINNLYLEKQEILQLLENQTIRNVSFSYTNSSGSRTSLSGEILYENDTSITVKASSGGTLVNKSDIIPNTLNRTYVLRPVNQDILPKYEPKITRYGNQISISYEPVNQYHYWINLDPHQCAVRDFEKNPKVLIKTTYKCSLANPIDVRTPVFGNNVCPFTNASDLPSSSSGGTENFKQIGPDEWEYEINPSEVGRQRVRYQQDYSIIRGWKKITKERYFTINGDQTRDLAPAQEILVRAQEEYWIPKIPSDDLPISGNVDNSGDTQTLSGIQKCQTDKDSPGGFGLLSTVGSRLGKPMKIINVINLDNIDTISVDIKRVPRMLRGVDFLATVYRYGLSNLYRQAKRSSPLVPFDIDLVNTEGSLNNNFYYWTCFQKNLTTNLLESAALPEFFKLQNEMIFRSFFGSVDRIENKTESMSSLYPWELIPYEYDNDT